MTQLNPIDSGLWAYEYEVGLLARLAVFPVKSWVVDIGGEQLAIISPGPIDDDLAAELAAIGEVRYLIAPNCFHHIHLMAARARYPQAKVYLAPGLHAKRPKLEFDHELGPQPDPAWAGVLDQVSIEGAPKLGEVVFFHRPSQTLLITDLVFNLHAAPGLLSGMIFRMVGAYKKLASSALLKSVCKDRAAVGASVDRILQWDFNRLMVAHGDTIESEAKPALAQALAWLGTRSP